MDELLQDFTAETRETLEAISGELVAWEADPTDRARLDAIFRFVHTVKGSCGFLDLPRLGRLAHAAEDVLAAARDGLRQPDTALVSAVLAIVDRIGELNEAIVAGAPLDDSTDDLLIAALAEDAAPAAPISGTGPSRTVIRSVRLGVDLLDRMMIGMSDMVLARNELARRLRDTMPDPRIEGALERLSASVADMRDTVTRTRMQRVETLFAAVPRMVRDSAATLGKNVALTIEGADVELDREMIELLRDPLVHIIRNAVDHGIESPAERRAAGKAEAGRLVLCARQSGNRILIEIADDGRGIDTDRVAAKAVAAGLHTESEVARMDEAQRARLIFHAGLSSRDTVTDLSGRGVGMDVVRANIEQFGGRVELRNQRGRGLTLTLQVPLTLSIIPTIVVGVGDQRFAVPRQAIEEIVSLTGGAVRIDTLGGRQVATVRGRRLPMVGLGAVMGIADEATRALVIVSTRDGDYALGIDAVLDSEELVVKPAAPAVMASGIYAGQTLPDSGLPLLLLDCSGIATVAGLRFGLAADAVAEAGAAEAPGIPALWFDDLDGRRRAIALAVVDRVESVAAEAIRWSGGRLHLAMDERVIPLVAMGDVPVAGEVTLLRLTDGHVELFYAVAEAQEIVRLPAAMAPARDRPGIAGVVVIEGEQVELLDPHALFAGEVRAPASRPLCHLRCDGTGWMDTFLRPVLEAAGYRCTTAPGGDESVAVTLAMEELAADVDADVERLVRLSRRPLGPAGSGSGDTAATVYRYDRAALIAAVAERAGRAVA